MDKKIRELAIELLDNENGMSLPAYKILSDLLKETGSEDIIKAVNNADDAPYLGEDDAEDFRNGNLRPEEVEEVCESKSVIEIPICSTCPRVIIQPQLNDGWGSEEVVGCQDLTKMEWTDGWKKGQQHNCPLIA